MMDRPDWKTANEELIKEALRQGELRLQAQVQLATSADQRATMLAGIYIAASTGLLAALAALAATASGSHPMPLALIVGAAATALAFLAGAIFCILAVLPSSMHSPGNDPHEWYADIKDGKDHKVSLGEQSDWFDQHIIANRRMLKRNAGF